MNSWLVVMHVILSFFIVIIVLLQPATKGGGLGSTFSGGYTTDSAFGARGPVPFLMKLTYWLAAAIMLTSLMLEIGLIKQSWCVLDRGSVPSVSVVAGIESDTNSSSVSKVDADATDHSEGNG